MKISKLQSRKLTIIFIVVLLFIYVTIVFLAKLSLLEASLLLLAIPMILFITINLMVPMLKKELHRIQKKETSDQYYAAKRKQFKAKGLTDYTQAEWNLAGIEIWALNNGQALKKYHSIEGKHAIATKKNKSVAYYANNAVKN